MFHVSKRQLQSWKQRQLLDGIEEFSFRDIIALRALLQLRSERVSIAKIGKALGSLRRKLSHIKSPLSELKLLWDGKRFSVLVAGQTMDAETGQISLEFESARTAELTTFAAQVSNKKQPASAEAEHWFQQGLSLEESGAPVQDSIAAYEKAIELNPSAAGALVNLGTIYFRDGKLKKAEGYYRRALAADPRYPLAHFNLANLFDEQGQIDTARKHYLEAIRLDPKYADALFNLALLCEQAGESMMAIGYWNAYLKLDWASSWADIARRQMERLKQAAVAVSR
jgi:tetratricopeptide (TPR) repeat protein